MGFGPTGTRIDVTMRLHPFVAALMPFWLGGVGLIGRFVIADGEAAEWSLAPIGMFGFGLALTLGAFYPEAIKARRILEQHLRQTGA